MRHSNTTPSAMGTAVVARQPICDNNQRTFAYELLYRKPNMETAVVDNPEAATAQVILHSFTDIGLDRMAGKANAFINVSRDFILGDYCRSLPRERVVIEILEDTVPDAALLSAVGDLTREGYTFALDDYSFEDHMRPLIPYCKYVKVDARLSSPDLIKERIGSIKEMPIKLLAEKVESADEFAFFKNMGFDYFQGFFFSRPLAFSSNKIPRNRATLCQLLAKLHDPETDTRQIERAVSEDLSLSYQLLRYINSAALAMPRKIESVGHAVRMVGINHIRLLASLMMLANVEDKPQELLTTSLIRARMCENIARQHNFANPDAYFTVGLFSVLDVFLDCRLEEALKHLPLSDAICNALLHRKGSMGDVLHRVVRYEAGDWAALDDIQADYGVLSRAYYNALEFGQDLLQQIRTVAQSRPAGLRPASTLA